MANGEGMNEPRVDAIRKKQILKYNIRHGVRKLNIILASFIAFCIICYLIQRFFEH